MPAQYALRKVAYATAVLSACAWLNGCGTGSSMPEQTASAPVAKATSTQNKPPNVIVILADDMGFNDIEPFGQDAISTPNLNAMAQEGMRFTNFHVHATCSPTRAQLLTGVDNHLAGMGSMGEYRTPEMDKYPGSYIGSLNNRVKTIAEMLQERACPNFCVNGSDFN